MKPIVVALLALFVGGCGEASSAATGAWERLPDAPLSAREAGLALPVGGDVLVIGGSDADPCPPSADCAAPVTPPLRDGARFDPQARTWTRIAPAPVGFAFAEGAVVGGTAYVLTDSGVFLGYRVAADRWVRLPRPPGGGDRSIVAANGKVVAFTTSDEHGEAPDERFDAATRRWSRLPDDPLPRSFDRAMAWSGKELVLFAHELVPQPGATKPSLVIAAALDADSGRWRRLPDSKILGQGARWFAADGKLILPALGSADGGEVGNWGRPYPNGGILDPATGTWSKLPASPAGDAVSGGVLAGSRADYFGTNGWILDATAGTWIEIPTLDQLTGRTVAAAGTEMLAFGGVRWDGQRGRLLRETWLWTAEG